MHHYLIIHLVNNSRPSKRNSLQLVPYHHLGLGQLDVGVASFRWGLHLRLYLSSLLCLCLDRRVVRIDLSIHSILAVCQRFFLTSFNMFLPFLGWVDLGNKRAFLEILIDLLLLLFDHLFDLMFLPDVNPFKEGGITIGKVTFVMLDDRLKGAFYIDFVLAALVLLE